MAEDTNSNSTKDLLDGKYYNLVGAELAFFKSQSGIQDEDALKEHIMEVQAEAYKVYRYRCILRFNFTKLKISRLPAYSQLLKLGREREGAIFLDIGCCFGNDVRKAVADGFPVEGAIASDLHPEFWALGHKLFNTTPESFPVPFIPGDALSPSFLPTIPPFYSPPSTPPPALSSLSSLGPLHGLISAIHASSFFHLFDEPRQLQLAHALGGLLSPLPGSLIFGAHGGRSAKGLRKHVQRDGQSWRTEPMFCHSPESWAELWDGGVFEKGTVRVEASLKEREREGADPVAEDDGVTFGTMVWSVTRL